MHTYQDHRKQTKRRNKIWRQNHQMTNKKVCVFECVYLRVMCISFVFFRNLLLQRKCKICARIENEKRNKKNTSFSTAQHSHPLQSPTEPNAVAVFVFIFSLDCLSYFYEQKQSKKIDAKYTKQIYLYISRQTKNL